MLHEAPRTVRVAEAKIERVGSRSVLAAGHLDAIASRSSCDVFRGGEEHRADSMASPRTIDDQRCDPSERRIAADEMSYEERYQSNNLVTDFRDENVLPVLGCDSFEARRNLIRGCRVAELTEQVGDRSGVTVAHVSDLRSHPSALDKLPRV